MRVFILLGELVLMSQERESSICRGFEILTNYAESKEGSRESRMTVLILLGSKNSVGNSHIVAEWLSCWRVKLRTLGKAYSCLEEVQELKLYATLRMRIFILSGTSGT